VPRIYTGSANRTALAAAAPPRASNKNTIARPHKEPNALIRLKNSAKDSALALRDS
jgi:hypothetical protein